MNPVISDMVEFVSHNVATVRALKNQEGGGNLEDRKLILGTLVNIEIAIEIALAAAPHDKELAELHESAAKMVRTERDKLTTYIRGNTANLHPDQPEH